MAALMRLSCISLYIAIKVLSTSADVSRGGVRGGNKEEDSQYFSLFCSPPQNAKDGSGRRQQHKPSKGSKGREVAWVWRDVGEEGQ